MAPSYMSESQFINEKSFLYGAFLSAIAYGIVTTLAIICTTILKGKRIPIRHRKAQMIYVMLLFCLSTLNMAFEIKITQVGFLEQRDYMGGTAGYYGPAAYLGKHFDHAVPLEFAVWMSCLVITNWFCDIILLWRCLVLYQDNQFWPRVFRYLPLGLITASFITGILHLIQITAPETSSWATANFPVNLTIIYGVVALLVNITLTSLIAVRLYIHRRRATKALGSDHGTEFTSVIAMLIESAVLADVFVISFLVPYAARHWFANVMIQPLVQAQAIAPLLIIYRVARGKAWSTTTIQDLNLSSSSSSFPRYRRPTLSFGTGIGMGQERSIVNIVAQDRERPSSSSSFDPYSMELGHTRFGHYRSKDSGSHDIDVDVDADVDAFLKKSSGKAGVTTTMNSESTGSSTGTSSPLSANLKDQVRMPFLAPNRYRGV